MRPSVVLRLEAVDLELTRCLSDLGRRPTSPNNKPSGSAPSALRPNRPRVERGAGLAGKVSAHVACVGEQF